MFPSAGFDHLRILTVPEKVPSFNPSFCCETVTMTELKTFERRHEYFRCISLLQLFVLHMVSAYFFRHLQFERYYCEGNQAQVHLRSGEQTETFQNT